MRWMRTTCEKQRWTLSASHLGEKHWMGLSRHKSGKESRAESVRAWQTLNVLADVVEHHFTVYSRMQQAHQAIEIVNAVLLGECCLRAFESRHRLWMLASAAAYLAMFAYSPQGRFWSKSPGGLAGHQRWPFRSRGNRQWMLHALVRTDRGVVEHQVVGRGYGLFECKNG